MGGFDGTPMLFLLSESMLLFAMGTDYLVRDSRF